MIILIVLLLLLLAGIILGPYLQTYNAYVLIAFENWTIETRLAGLLLIIAGLIAVGLLLYWLVKMIIRASRGSFSFFGSWSSRRQQRAFTRGLVALEEQNFQEAQKQLDKASRSDAFSGVDLLAAAQAAMRLKQPEKAIELWKKASKQSATELAAKLHLARHALSHQDYQEALVWLEGLAEKHDDHPSVVHHWAEALAGLGRWQELQQSLKGWKKVLGMERYDHWMRAAALGTFSEIASKQGANELKETWQKLPRSVRKDPAQQAAYVGLLIDQEMHVDAADALVGFMSSPEPQLLPLFKLIKAKQPTAAIKQLEGWLKKDEENVAVMSALGHLAFNAGQYRLAEKVISLRLKLEDDIEDRYLLADIKEALHQPMEALAIYKEAVQAENERESA